MKLLRTHSIRPDSIVFVRVDWNVPIGNDGVIDRTEDFKIKRSLPTLEYLLKRKVRLVLATHLGRPGGKFDKRFNLHPIKRRGQYLLGRPIHYIHEVSPRAVKEALIHTDPQGVVLLENLRFYPQEEQNDSAWAKTLSSWANLYVNDAFGACHRAHASVAAITQHIPSVAGLLLEQEVQVLDQVTHHDSKHPYLVILGGAKIKGKIDLVHRLCALADNVVLGGGIANTMLFCNGVGIGRSLNEAGERNTCSTLLGGDCRNKLILPSDVVVGRSLHSSRVTSKSLDTIRSADVIGDIGSASVKSILPLIRFAKTIVWNGPVGFSENLRFAQSGKRIAQAIAKSRAFSIAGGGETVSMLVRYGLVDNFSFVSTGGGAMIEYLEGRKLPGIEALKRGARR